MTTKIMYEMTENMRGVYNKTNFTKSPASGTVNVSEPRVMSRRESARNRVRVDQRVSAARVAGGASIGLLT